LGRVEVYLHFTERRIRENNEGTQSWNDPIRDFSSPLHLLSSSAEEEFFPLCVNSQSQGIFLILGVRRARKRPNESVNGKKNAGMLNI